MIVKVCGLREPDNIRAVADLGVDWLGFIFFARSTRSIDKAVFNCQLSTVNCKRVGVFVNASPESMMQTAARYNLHYLQLHGDEPAEDCSTLREKGYGVIKAFSIATADDLERTRAYEGRADYFLFDTKCSGYGGSGRQFDWDILAAYRGDTPFLLSGGIRPDSVGDILRFSHPRFAGIDLNSGFEVRPGFKDIERLREFIRQIR